MINTTSRINLLAFISCLLWSTAFVGIRIGIEYSPPIQFAGLRFFIAGLLIFPFIKSKKSIFKEIRKNLLFIIKVAFFHTFMQYSLFYSGVARVSGANSAIIIGASPVIIAVMSHFFMINDKLNFKKLLSILFAFVGVVLVALSKPFSSVNSVSYYIGIALLLLTNINSGYSNIFIAKKKHDMSPLALTSISLIIGGIMLLLFAFFTEPVNLVVYPIKYYLALGWLSFLSAAAISIWMYILKIPGISVSNINVWKFVIPIVGALLAWIILPDEYPEVVSVVGMIVTAIALLILNKK